MTLRLEAVAPVLPVSDVRAALERYRRLGFQAQPYLEAGVSTDDNRIYGNMSWGVVEIHLSGFDALDPRTNTAGCYLW